jgi:hypothetical protein
MAIVAVNGALAQLVEQRTLNPFVASSILARPTKKFANQNLIDKRLTGANFDINPLVN